MDFENQPILTLPMMKTRTSHWGDFPKCKRSVKVIKFYNYFIQKRHWYDNNDSLFSVFRFLNKGEKLCHLKTLRNYPKIK